jgi:hypothetical protein
MSPSEISKGDRKMETHHQAKPMPHRVADRTQIRLLVFLVLLVAAAVVVLVVSWLVFGSGGAKTSLPPVGNPAAAVSTAQLKAVAAQTNHPVYWAGARSGAYELTRTTDGRTYIRYLPSAADVGDPAANYLTVGTYQRKDAFTAIQRAAARAGAVSVKIDNGGLLVFNEKTPKSVYFGYPRADYQVEVFDPSPQQARTLVLGGSIKPIR